MIQGQESFTQNLMNDVSELSCRSGSINNFKGSSLKGDSGETLKRFESQW